MVCDSVTFFLLTFQKVGSLYNGPCVFWPTKTGIHNVNLLPYGSTIGFQILFSTSQVEGLEALTQRNSLFAWGHEYPWIVWRRGARGIDNQEMAALGPCELRQRSLNSDVLFSAEFADPTVSRRILLVLFCVRQCSAVMVTMLSLWSRLLWYYITACFKPLYPDYGFDLTTQRRFGFEPIRGRRGDCV